ncbi:MAG: hypothetical protein BWY14_00174 [Parcubacteria group bacterium ADurb.Bin192]|nr:MAG: hypothetical protein BWY14_00174 [Parcubacteria group bacterium ADurb.Bin192]
MRITSNMRIILILGLLTFPFLVIAATSTNFDLTQEHGGPVDFRASSTNYQFNAEIGHPGAGVSTSTNYVYWHGTFWEEDLELVTATIQWAVPEMRVGATSTNDDAIFYLTVKDPGTHAAVYTMPVLASTTVAGTYLTPIDLGSMPAGNYDVAIKTHQHLTKILRNVPLSTGNVVLNFTQPDNSAPYGTSTLLAGDVSGSTSTPATMGDDVVNSVDLSIIINDLDKDDLTTRGIRSNLNQDPVVNSVDLSLMLKNLDVEGDN